MSERGLAGKVVIVTGAGGGIARATAEAFAAEGCKLVLADIDSDGLEDIATQLRANGTTVDGVIADVTDDAGARSVVEAAQGRHGRVEVLANVVGVALPGQNVTEVTQADWDAVVRLTLTATFLMCHYVLPIMEAQ